MSIAREGLAHLVRWFREEIAEMSRAQLSMVTGVSRKALNRLEHASPRQNRWEVEWVIRFFKLSRHKRFMELQFEERKMLAWELLNLCFPAEVVIPRQESDIPQHLLVTFTKRNRRRVRRFKQWPHKVRPQRLVSHQH